MSNHDPLRDALRNRADQLGDTSPLTLDDVKGRAQGIRRRRTAVTGLAAAAVLAVAVPAGIAVTNNVGGRPDTGPAASPSLTPTPDESTDDPTPDGPHRVTLTTDADAGSYAPGIPYLYDGAIVRPDGSEVPVDADYSGLAPVGDGWVALRNDEGDFAVDLLDADGNVTGSKPSGYSLAVSQDGTVAAYATPDGQLMTVVPNAAPMPLIDPEALPGGMLDPVAVIGSDSCLENAEGGGCVVFFNSSDVEEQTAWSATAKGIVSPFPDLLALGGRSPDGSVSGLVSVAEDSSGSCSAVLGQDWDKTAWETCDYTLGAFSPDGRYVIGHPAQEDGIGDSSVAILDARTGALLAEYSNSEQHPAFINTVVWDEDGTLLATVFEGSWSLMRMTPGGELTTVSGDLGDDMDAVPLRLSARP